MNQKSLISELKEAWQVAILNKRTMHDVAGSENKTAFGFYIIIAAAVLGIIGQQLFPIWLQPSIGIGIGMGVIQVISTIIGIYVVSIIAKSIFKGHAKHTEFFRVMAYGLVVTWLGLIPQLSIIGGIWALVIFFVILKTIHKLTTGGVIGTIILSILAMAVISLILTPLYGLIGANSLMKGGFQFKGVSNYFNTDKGSFNFNDEEGSVSIKDGAMKITGEDGETIEINIPSFR